MRFEIIGEHVCFLFDEIVIVRMTTSIHVLTYIAEYNFYDINMIDD